MDDERGNFNRPLLWFFLDGSASISFSMLLALLLYAGWCDGLPVLGWLAEVTRRDNGVIIVASLLLFTCTLVLYGVLTMFFAAKETAERRARRRTLRDINLGINRGRRQEQDRIVKLLAKHGVAVSPELARDMADGLRDERDD